MTRRKAQFDKPRSARQVRRAFEKALAKNLRAASEVPITKQEARLQAKQVVHMLARTPPEVVEEHLAEGEVPEVVPE